MTWTTDNRFSPGGSHSVVPDTAIAAYSARWIDNGNGHWADILGDRQGFAYNTEADRDHLIERLLRVDTKMRHLTDEVERDAVYCDNFPQDGEVLFYGRRRAGGYVYVDAWLDTIKKETP